MSGLERLIIDLVQVAEAPLYSTYRWLGHRLGRDVTLDEFLRVVAHAIERDVLRLWSVDAKTGDRTELYEIPPDLESRYIAVMSLDTRYDPFAMSLTLGAAADVDAEPEWEFTINFDDQTFEIAAAAGREEWALDQLARCYPDFRPIVTAVADRGERRHLTGILRHATES